MIGFESVAGDAVRTAGKRQNRPHQYREIVRQLTDHGIAVWGGFIFGLDGDPPDAFERTVDFCIEAKLAVGIFSLLTPYPGTALYERLRAEGRLTKESWWLDAGHEADAPLFRPATLSREALRAGWVRAWRSMYSMSSIRRRYSFSVTHSWTQNVAYWPLNLMLHELAEKKIGAGARTWRKYGAILGL